MVAARPTHFSIGFMTEKFTRFKTTTYNIGENDSMIIFEDGYFYTSSVFDPNMTNHGSILKQKFLKKVMM